MIDSNTYSTATNCQKALYLSRHNPSLAKVTEPKNTTERAQLISILKTSLEAETGLVAMDIADSQESVATRPFHTMQAINSCAQLIVNATFNNDGVLSKFDALLFDADKGGYIAYSLTTATKAKKDKLSQVAYHTKTASVDVVQNVLVHVNNEFTLVDGKVTSDILAFTDVTSDISERLDVVGYVLKSIPVVLNGSEPDVEIGGQCKNAGVDCEFKAHCWKEVNDTSTANLYNTKSHLKFGMYHGGLPQLSDLNPWDDSFKEIQSIQIECAISGQDHIDTSVLKTFFSGLQFPLQFLDYETFADVIPRFDNQTPYKPMPFQYSLHTVHEDGTIEHKEFLAEASEDPRANFAERLLADLGNEGDIIVYYAPFEKRITKELANDMPLLKEELLSLLTRIVDLRVPFSKGGYYTNAFAGSFSIKAILPAMFPNDPELDYKALGMVQNGEQAMTIFADLRNQTNAKVVSITRRDLLAYCRLDTLAMVKIYFKLHSIWMDNTAAQAA